VEIEFGGDIRVRMVASVPPELARAVIKTLGHDDRVVDRGTGMGRGLPYRYAARHAEPGAAGAGRAQARSAFMSRARLCGGGSLQFIEAKAHVFAAERIHGDDTTVPVLAKTRCRTGRIWTYLRDDRPFGGEAPPAAVFF
jgi:hypothetical protein